MGKGLGRRRLVIAAVIAALVVVPAALVITQQRAASAATILSILDGSASVARGTAAFVAAVDGDIVNTGDRVQTADRSHALVTFFDGSTLEIEPATTVQIEEAQAEASGAIGIRIAQTIGRTWSSVQKLTHVDSKFEVRTPTLTAAVRGTGFITEVLSDGTSSVQTVDGSVQVTAQGQSVLVGAGQTTTAQPNSPPTAPGPSSPPPNRLRFGMHSPAYLVVLDPFGRACGVVQPGPTVVRQIPGCLTSEPGTDPQLVDVPNALPGLYRVLIAVTAPGGAFTATASAVDGSGALSFNYTASGSGEPGAKFGTGLDVTTGPNGALSANGLGPLTVVERSPVKLVLGSTSPRPTVSGTPDTSLFAPLPGIGFAAGRDVTPFPLATTTPSPTLLLPSPTLTVVPTTIPTSVATFVPTLPPTPLPTPTPLPPTLSGGQAAPGGTLAVLGTNWPVGAVVTIKWPDGSQVGGADVLSDGRFATLIRVPQSALPGMTYKITATGGGLTQTADVVIAVVYSPSLTLTPNTGVKVGTPVTYNGSGFPPQSGYAVSLDGRTTIASGVTGSDGSFTGSFSAPSRGSYTVIATSGAYSATASLTTQ